MKKVKAIVLLALLSISPLLFGAGSGGFPSRPKFSALQVTGTTTAGQAGGICQIGLMPTGANQVNNLNESCDFARANGNFTLLALGQANFQGKQNTNFYTRIGTTAAPGGTAIESRLQFIRGDRSVYPEAAAIFLWDLGYTSSNLPGSNAGHDYCLRRYDDTGATIDTGGTFGDCTFFVNRATGAVGIKNALTSEKPCVAGHTRLSPNFCRRDSGGNNVLAAGTDGTCKQTATLSGTDIKAVVGYIRATVYSANAVGARSLTIGFFSDAACTAQLHSESYEVYEQAAIAAGTALTKKYLPLVITSSTAGQFYMKETGGDGVADFIQTGYLD